MHVVLDARLADYAPGGIAQYTLLLAGAMAEQLGGTRLTLLRAARPKVRPEPLPPLPCALALTPPHHRLEQLVLPFELARLRPDVVHSPDFIPPFLRPWRPGRPWRSVVTVHDLAFLRFPEALTPASRRYYGQVGRAVRAADAVIAVSGCTRDDLVQLLGADPARVTVICEAANPSFRPVDDPEALAAAHRRLGVTRPFVLFVGNLEPRKNLPLLLEAFALVRREADLELALVGRRGWLDEPVFDRIAALGLEAYVRHVEGLAPSALPAAYSAAALLAFPSLYEGFGLPPLEAMACGCPVVASDRGALPEVVGEAGLLVPADDASALADAMLSLATDPARRAEYVRRGLARAAEFSWQRAAAETLAVYRRVAA